MRDLIIDQLTAAAQAANRAADQLLHGLDEMDAATALDTAVWQLAYAGRLLGDMGKRLERISPSDDDMVAAALTRDALRTSVQTAMCVAEMAAENLGDQAAADAAYDMGRAYLVANL